MNTRRNYKNLKNNTHTKRKINKNNNTKRKINNKTNFINKIIYYWKKHTGGNVKMDIYLKDYYFSFDKTHNRDNHIHLLLKGFNYSHDNHDNIKYAIKRVNPKTLQIEHIKNKKISFHSNPETVTKNMIAKFNEFLNS